MSLESSANETCETHGLPPIALIIDPWWKHQRLQLLSEAGIQWLMNVAVLRSLPVLF